MRGFPFLKRRRPSPREAFAGLSDEAWLGVLIASLTNRSERGVLLPGFPEERWQLGFVGSSGEIALHEAFRFFRRVKALAALHGRPLGPASRILDFGCGWGRMLRFFLKDVRAENLMGVDVDPVAIQLCRETYPYGRFEMVRAMPPATALTAAQFDLIYLYSVFSHLNETSHLAWLDELTGLLAPGGLLVATTQGRAFLDFCEAWAAARRIDNEWHAKLARAFPDLAAARAAYDSGEFVHAPTGTGDVRSASFYGETLIPRAYVEMRWPGRGLRFLDFQDRTVLQRADDGDPLYVRGATPEDLPQALVVMQKA